MSDSMRTIRRSNRLGLAASGLLALMAACGTPEFGDWSAPVNLGDFINSAFDDDGPAVSRDGLRLYFNSTRPGGAGGQDIWVAQRDRESDPWGAPVNLPTLNTSANDFAPAFSRDGRRMFFVSNRAGGLGGVDIWVSFREREGDDFGWQAPVNLGAAINATSNDAGPGLSGEGDDLFFTSNRPGGSGGPDIWMSARQKDGSFGPPVPVTELNSADQDARAAVHRDGRELFFFSNRAAGSLGATDLWTATRNGREGPWSTPVNLGSTVNSPSDEMQPAISDDGRTLFFASNRPGGSGLLDLYMITRKKDE